MVYLGRDNPYQIESLRKAQEGKENDPELQGKRGDVWVTKIEPSPEIEQSLLIVGREHARNTFGLVDKLSQKGIKLVEITDFGVYDKNFEYRLRDQTATRLAASLGLDKSKLLEMFDKVIV